MNVMTALIALNAALFETDPANTCCKENDCSDEYLAFARESLIDIENGVGPVDALVSNFQYYFAAEDTPVLRAKCEEVIKRKIQLEQSS